MRVAAEGPVRRGAFRGDGTVPLDPPPAASDLPGANTARRSGALRGGSDV